MLNKVQLQIIKEGGLSIFQIEYEDKKEFDDNKFILKMMSDINKDYFSNSKEMLDFIAKI